jgi:hypothetical protein
MYISLFINDYVIYIYIYICNGIEINFITQADSGGKVNIFEDYSISHCEKKSSYEHVSNSEWLPHIILGEKKKKKKTSVTGNKEREITYC